MKVLVFLFLFIDKSWAIGGGELPGSKDCSTDQEFVQKCQSISARAALPYRFANECACFCDPIGRYLDPSEENAKEMCEGKVIENAVQVTNLIRQFGKDAQTCEPSAIAAIQNPIAFSCPLWLLEKVDIYSKSSYFNRIDNPEKNCGVIKDENGELKLNATNEVRSVSEFENDLYYNEKSTISGITPNHLSSCFENSDVPNFYQKILISDFYDKSNKLNAQGLSLVKGVFEIDSLLNEDLEMNEFYQACAVDNLPEVASLCNRLKNDCKKVGGLDELSEKVKSAYLNHKEITNQIEQIQKSSSSDSEESKNKLKGLELQKYLIESTNKVLLGATFKNSINANGTNIKEALKKQLKENRAQSIAELKKVNSASRCLNSSRLFGCEELDELTQYAPSFRLPVDLNNPETFTPQYRREQATNLDTNLYLDTNQCLQETAGIIENHDSALRELRNGVALTFATFGVGAVLSGTAAVTKSAAIVNASKVAAFGVAAGIDLYYLEDSINSAIDSCSRDFSGGQRNSFECPKDAGEVLSDYEQSVNAKACAIAVAFVGVDLLPFVGPVLSKQVSRALNRPGSVATPSPPVTPISSAPQVATTRVAPAIPSAPKVEFPSSIILDSSVVSRANPELLAQINNVPGIKFDLNSKTLEVDVSKLPEGLRQSESFLSQLQGIASNPSNNQLKALANRLDLGNLDFHDIYFGNPQYLISESIRAGTGISLSSTGALRVSDEIIDGLSPNAKDEVAETLRKIHNSYDTSEINNLSKELLHLASKGRAQNTFSRTNAFFQGLVKSDNKIGYLLEQSERAKKVTPGSIPDNLSPGIYQIDHTPESSIFLKETGVAANAGIIKRTTFREVGPDGKVTASYVVNTKADGGQQIEYILKDQSSGDISFGVIDQNGNQVDAIPDFRKKDPSRSEISANGLHPSKNCTACHGVGKFSEGTFRSEYNPAQGGIPKGTDEYLGLFNDPWQF